MRVKHGNGIAEIAAHIGKSAESHDANARRCRLQKRIQALILLLELVTLLGDPLHLLNMRQQHTFQIRAIHSRHQLSITALHAGYAIALINDQKE